MSEYLSYIKAFSSDLREIAVWEPGNKVELGDYGEVHNQRWDKLGNVWEDLIPNADRTLREYEISALDRLSLGSAEVIYGNSNANFDSVASRFSLSIRFGREHSVFLRADKCETRTLRRVQKIAEQLAQRRVWQRSWTFVNAVCCAERFSVLIGESAGGQVQVTARTNELLDAFMAGNITIDSGIRFSGSKVLSFLGNNGPIHRGY